MSNEIQSAGLPFWVLRAIRSVLQLRDANDRNGGINLTEGVAQLFEDLRDSMTSSFRDYKHAGIEH